MKSVSILLALATFSIVASQNNTSWDYLLLVSRWPGTVAYDGSVPSNVTGFTLHGVWPTRNDGSWPSYCNNSQPFSPSAISSLVPDLWEVWYDYTGNGYDFWSHEWDKHGTCAESDSSMDSEFNYFQSAINLVNKYQAEAALSSAGITPTFDSSYDTNDVISALLKSFGVHPLLTCQHVDDVGWCLDMVEFCITPNFAVEECPGTANVTCYGQIWLPPISYDD